MMAKARQHTDGGGESEMSATREQRDASMTGPRETGTANSRDCLWLNEVAIGVRVNSGLMPWIEKMLISGKDLNTFSLVPSDNQPQNLLPALSADHVTNRLTGATAARHQSAKTNIPVFGERISASLCRSTSLIARQRGGSHRQHTNRQSILS